MRLPKILMSKRDRFHFKPKQKVGNWTVLYETAYKSNSSTKRVRMYACECICGTKRAVRMLALRHGQSKHCGCLQKEQVRKANTKHGFRKTKLHKVYQNMLNRCYKPENERYRYYGGRGIKVCKEWREGGLAVFGKWAMENGYEDKLQLDRKHNDKDYTPKNCRFVTRKINMNNQSTNLYIKHEGKKYSFRQFWEIYGKVGYGTVLYRYHNFRNRCSLVELFTLPSKHPLFRKKQNKRLVMFKKKAA